MFVSGQFESVVPSGAFVWPVCEGIVTPLSGCPFTLSGDILCPFRVVMEVVPTTEDRNSMNKRRRIGRYVIAGSLTALYSAAMTQAYRDLGKEREPLDVLTLKKMGAVAGLLTGLTWLAATL